jgi:hypothetical protein
MQLITTSEGVCNEHDIDLKFPICFNNFFPLYQMHFQWQTLQSYVSYYVLTLTKYIVILLYDMSWSKTSKCSLCFKIEMDAIDHAVIIIFKKGPKKALQLKCAFS